MAETLAAAVRQHHRGLLIGETTYGKGVAQSLHPILDEGVLALTTRVMFYPGTRSTWDGEGIAPDFHVPLAARERDLLDAILDAPLLDLEDQIAYDPALTLALDLLEACP